MTFRVAGLVLGRGGGAATCRASEVAFSLRGVLRVAVSSPPGQNRRSYTTDLWWYSDTLEKPGISIW